MARTNPDKFRRDRATELRNLAQLLSKHEVVNDLSPLYSAVDKCSKNTPNGKNSWGYDFDRLWFLVKTPRHTLPKEIGDHLNVELSVSLKGVCEYGSDDPFKELSVSLEVSANDSPTPKNLCAWHLDRHILEAGDHESEEVHPLYHFQHGGQRMYGLENLGNVLLLDPPRLLHPPLDAILAVDFVLSNFMGAKWKQLRDDGEYENMIINAQELFWKPYVNSLSAGWGSVPERQGRNTLLLWPNLVVSA